MKRRQCLSSGARSLFLPTSSAPAIVFLAVFFWMHTGILGSPASQKNTANKRDLVGQTGQTNLELAIQSKLVQSTEAGRAAKASSEKKLGQKTKAGQSLPGQSLPVRVYPGRSPQPSSASYSGPTEALRFFVRIFQVVFSPQDGPTCPYRPVCSAYARQAYRAHGPAVGTVMTAERLIRCNHDAPGGADPVPDGL